MIIYNFEKIVDVDKLIKEINQSGLLNFLYVSTAHNQLSVCFSSTLSTEDQTTLNTLVSSHIAFDQQKVVQNIISNAMNFGSEIVKKVATENVMLGITQAGKTKIVADVCKNLQYYLTTGSLYVAIDEINRLIAEELDPNLEPFVTEARLNSVKSEIQSYLGIV